MKWWTLVLVGWPMLAAAQPRRWPREAVEDQ